MSDEPSRDLGELLFCDWLILCDDLRTRSCASVCPRGRTGRDDRERREHGAGNHPPPGKLGVCAVGSSGQAQSPRGAAATDADDSAGGCI